ncbi:MAG: DUF1828 domain-containing protein [Maritimibacter sp.]|nr:DUF1828 domain-containing protein [Maritimibacter sp.]
MKNELCKAFCETISVREVGAGLAVSTTSASINGDPVGFYVVGPENDGRYRIEDSGQLVPFLFAAGADLDNSARRTAFEAILAEHGASLDEDTLEIVSDPMPMSSVPGAAIRFVSLLIRLSDLAMWSHERVASNFKQDATARLKERLAGQASIEEGVPVTDALGDWEPDLVIRAEHREPVALFLVQNDSRAMEAMLLQADAEKYSAPVTVVALRERNNSISQRMQAKVSNRLDASPVFEGFEQDAIGRIAVEALGKNRGLH